MKWRCGLGMLWVSLIGLIFAVGSQANAAINLQFFSSPSYSVSSSGVWGQNINVNVSVKNFGTTNSGTFTVNLYVSNSTSITSTSYQLPSVSFPSLGNAQYAGGSNLSVALPSFIPTGLANGSNYIIAQISQNSLKTSGSINITSPPTNVQFYSNPAFGLTTSSTVQWGQSTAVGYQFSTFNYGAAADVVSNFYLSTTTSTTGAYSLGSSTPVNIPMGYYNSSSGSFNLPISIPSGLPTSGTIYLVVSLTVNGSVVATNSTPMTVSTPAADLVGYQGTINDQGTNYNVSFGLQQATSTWGQVVGLQYAIYNQAAGAAGSFNANLYLCQSNNFGSNNIPNSAAYYLGNISVSSLSGGHISYSVNGQGLPGYTNIIQLPNANPFGGSNTQFYIGMVINPSGFSGYTPITESIYTNNCNVGLGTDSAAITITAPQPKISVSGSNPAGSSTTLNFGNVNIGASGTQTVTISDTGPGGLTLNSMTTTGAFTITNVVSTIQQLSQPITYPASVAANGAESWVGTVTYKPTAAGTQNGTLTITSNDPSTPSTIFNLSGTGVTVPNLVFTNPVPFNNSNLIADFGGIANGSTTTKTFTLTNSGTAPLIITKNGITLTSTQSGVWSILSISSNTQGAVSLTNLVNNSYNIAPNSAETWTIVAQMSAPASTSTAYLSTGYSTGLQIFSNDPSTPTSQANSPTTVCALQGQGLIAMTLNVTTSVNGSTPTSSTTMNYGSVHATGKQKVNGAITLTNTGQIPLTLPQNGIALVSAANFQITSITSSTQPSISLASVAAGTSTIAANSAETWTINVVFNPTNPAPATSSIDNTTLNILSNDPLHGTQPIALNGTGLNQPGLLVTTPSGALTLPFGAVLNDGTGNHIGQQTFTLSDIGLQPVIVTKKGITLTNAAGYSIISIQSSTQGNITTNLTNGSVNIAANGAEVWTVTIGLDPTTNGSYTGSLGIASNDSVTPNLSLALTGSGTVPSLTMNPTTSATPVLYLPSGQIYNISWTASDTSDSSSQAVLTLSTAPTNIQPATGLTTVTTLPYSATTNSYAWRPIYNSASGANNTFYLYGSLSDNGVTSGSFSAQKVQIEPAGSFNLLSALTTTTAQYTYQYLYNGKSYSGTATLQPGANVIYISTPISGGGTAVHAITVNQVSSTLTAQGYTYDSLGRTSTYTNGNGITTTFTYSLAGKLIQTSATNGNVISYTYDNLNRKTTMIDGTGTTFYAYDDLDRVTSITTSVSGVLGVADNLVLSYQYDNAGNVTKLTYPGGEQVSYTYDNANRLLTVKDVVNATTTYNYTYTYNPTTGQLQTLSRGNGVLTTYSYDTAGRLNDIKHTKGTSTLAEYSYTLDDNGNATTLLTTFNTGPQKQELYTYDNQKRLIQVTYGAGNPAVPNTDQTVIYAYDGNGNRITQTTKQNGVVTQTLTYTYGSSNQLIQIVDQNNVQISSYVYDQAGNRIQKITPQGNTYYSFDERNLLTSVSTPSDYITYAYNGSAQRVIKILNRITTTNYVIDPSQKVFQTVQERSGGIITQSYAYGLDRLEVNPTGSTSQFYLPDRIGSVRVISDPNGNVLQTMNFNAFGVQQ